ncbi:jg12269 [Pararge aegeria aegeria]|uniref:Jg12269 protein n=1 Tax=Pararge aegeria aegeria TaxID=348720 RepID=A0A8S4QVU6_9NEOP|nr:jg12269 [Pararge aegeria aegeria]
MFLISATNLGSGDDWSERVTDGSIVSSNLIVRFVKDMFRPPLDESGAKVGPYKGRVHHFPPSEYPYEEKSSGRLTKNAVSILNIGTHQAANRGMYLPTCSTDHNKISDNADANSGQGTTCEIVSMIENPPVVISQNLFCVKKGWFF